MRLQPDTVYRAATDGRVFSFCFTTRTRAGAADAVLGLRQVHGCRLETVTPTAAGSEADGWVFDAPSRHHAAIRVADCLPVALYNPLSAKAAIVHCGHRGLSGGILQEAVLRLGGTRKAGLEAGGTLQAWLGPCIGPCCYQVQMDVAERFADWPQALSTHPEIGYWLDLRAVAAAQLAELGAKVLGVVEECTYCRPDLYHSYRREGAGNNGRQSLIASLHEAA